MKGNILGLLGICRKAGKLKMGFDAVEAALERDARLLLFTSDISPKTRERMLTKSADYGIPSLDIAATSFDVSATIGKKLAVMAITDSGLAKAAVKSAEQDTNSAEQKASVPSAQNATTTRRKLI